MTEGVRRDYGGKKEGYAWVIREYCGVREWCEYMRKGRACIRENHEGVRNLIYIIRKFYIHIEMPI